MGNNAKARMSIACDIKQRSTSSFAPDKNWGRGRRAKVADEKSSHSVCSDVARQTKSVASRTIYETVSK